MTAGSSLDIRTVSQITSRLLGEAEVRVTPVLGRGSVNQVFVAEAGERKLVVRLSDRAGAADEYAKEVWCIERAAAVGVPVPTVLGTGRCAGHAYIVQAHVDGDEGRDSPAPGADVWRELGRYARLIHSIKVPGFGLRLSEITRGDARASWLRHLAYNIESLDEDDPLLGLKVVTRPQAEAIRRVFASLRDRAFTFGLNHGDLALRNTIVDARGRVTLLDWGSAEAAAVPHHDLIQLLKTGMTEGEPDGGQMLAFLEGYGIAPAEFERMLPELEALLVLRAFDKLRWALEWGAEGLDNYISHAREAARRCLA